MKGFIVYPDYTIIDNQTHVRLFGKLENGQSFLTLNPLENYFFIKEIDKKKAGKYLSKFKTQKTNLTNFKKERVLKISHPIHTELNKLSSHLHKLEIETYEADIKPQYRFIMDNNLLGTIDIEGHFEADDKIDRIYQNPKITPSSFQPKLTVASVDTESDKSGKLFCIGIYSEKLKQVFMITDKKLKNTTPCKDEADCLEKFKAALIKLDPDIITGWNLIDFDLPYLKELFQKNKIPLTIGRTNDNPRLRIESNFFRSSTADIPGRIVLDGLNLIKDPFIKEAPSIKNAEFDSNTLEDVSLAILGKGKILKGKTRHDEIVKLYQTKSQASLQKLSDYNLLDCELVYKILEKTKTISLAIERSILTGMPLDRITASISSFDSLYIREARKANLVSPTTRFGLKEERITGGYVKESQPGIYHNLLVLDFKSLYPSILKTFNIDPASYLEKPTGKYIESPNKAYFKNQLGVLPKIITKLHAAREKAKKENQELLNYSIKIIMNSFWGVLASPNCRFFNFKMASAITSFARFIIQLTAKEVEKSGYKVIYSDTDSIFVETNLNKKEAQALGIKIQNQINKFYQVYIKKNYNRDSFLELEFEKLYLAFLMPKLRHTEAGAKKRYAGLIEKDGKEFLEIVGLEAIRGDWTEAAQDFQKQLLLKLFKKQEITKYIKQYITDLRSGKLDAKLIYSKSIRKNLSEYTKTTPPHVKAARLLDSLDSNIIKYYITTHGPEPIQKLKHKLDYEHYIKKQIAPIANQVLVLFDKTFDEIIQTSKQTTLF